MVLSGATFTLALPAQAQSTLPSLGDTSELSAVAERRIGNRIAASFYRDPDVMDDPVLAGYVQGIWQPLLTAARKRGDLTAELDERFAWQVFLIKDRSINAFALPGGYFGVHLGLVSTVGSTDELAAVLGHEMSHVTQRHISRLMSQQSQQTPWLIGAMILGALAASKNPDAATAAIVGGQAVIAQNQLSFSRDMEREADRIGFGLMADAGFDLRGATAMFEKLQQAARLNDNGSFPYLRSHPMNTERIADAQARIGFARESAAAAAATPTSPASKAAKAQSAQQALELHAMMAARAAVLVAPGVDALAAMLAAAKQVLGTSANTTPPPTRQRSAGLLYAGALAAAQLRDFANARQLASALLVATTSTEKLAPGMAFTPLEAARWLALEVELIAGVVPSPQLLAAAGLLDKSSNANSNIPGNRTRLLVQSAALLATRRTAEVTQALEALQNWTSVQPGDALAWQQLASAYTQQGQTVRAIRAEAESRAAQLDYAGALDRLKAAQGLVRTSPAVDYVEASILDTRTRQVNSLLREQILQDKIDR